MAHDQVCGPEFNKCREVHTWLERLEDLNDKIHSLLIPVHFFSTWLLVYDQVTPQSDHVVHKLEGLI